MSGNIATGKTTWTLRLAAALRVRAFPERPENNPWFGVPGAATLEELRFLLSSARDVAAAVGALGGVVERVPLEHVAIFGTLKRRTGLLTEAELSLLRDAHALLEPVLPPPDVLILLAAPPEELLRRVRARSRPGEDDVGLTTLETLAAQYETFAKEWHACPIVHLDTSAADPRNDRDVGRVVRSVREAVA